MQQPPESAPDTRITGLRPPADLEVARIFKKTKIVTDTDGIAHRVWTGANVRGTNKAHTRYGVLTLDGVRYQVARVVYQWQRGEVLDGQKTLRRTCTMELCIEDSHHRVWLPQPKSRGWDRMLPVEYEPPHKQSRRGESRRYRHRKLHADEIADRMVDEFERANESQNDVPLPVAQLGRDDIRAAFEAGVIEADDGMLVTLGDDGPMRTAYHVPPETPAPGDWSALEAMLDEAQPPGSDEAPVDRSPVEPSMLTPDGGDGSADPEQEG